MGVKTNGIENGPIVFTDDRPGRTIHVGPNTPYSASDGDVWIDSDALNNAGKNLLQTINLSTGGTSKSCTVSTDYKDAEIVIRGLNISNNAALVFRINGDVTASYVDSAGLLLTSLFSLDGVKAGVTTNHIMFNISDVNSTATAKSGTIRGLYTSSSTNLLKLYLSWGGYLPVTITPVTSITLTLTTGTFVGGTVLVYGVN